MILALAFGEAMQAEVVHHDRMTLLVESPENTEFPSSLQAHNGIANPDLLFVGKKLKIPSSGASEVTYEVKKETAWAESHPGLASRFPPDFGQ